MNAIVRSPPKGNAAYLTYLYYLETICLGILATPFLYYSIQLMVRFPFLVHFLIKHHTALHAIIDGIQEAHSC